MHVRFDQVEVFKLRHYSNDVTLLTKKSYQIDNFELDRQTKRRSKKRFHRSDLYREWVITQGLIVDDETDDGTSFFDDISSPSPNDRLAMEKIQEARIQKLKGYKSSMTRLTTSVYMILFHLYRQLIDLQWRRSRKQATREPNDDREGGGGKFFFIRRSVVHAPVPFVREA